MKNTYKSERLKLQAAKLALQACKVGIALQEEAEIINGEPSNIPGQPVVLLDKVAMNRLHAGEVSVSHFLRECFALAGNEAQHIRLGFIKAGGLRVQIILSNGFIFLVHGNGRKNAAAPKSKEKRRSGGKSSLH